MYKHWILPVGNKRRLGSTCCVLSANRWITINVINISQHDETAAYSKKRLPTLPFLAECFRILRSLSNFLFVNEVFSFLFRLFFDGFCSTARETVDPIDTTRHIAWTLQTATLVLLPSDVTNHQWSNDTLSCHCRRAEFGHSSGDAAEFCWWSVVSTGLSWLLISLVCLVSMVPAAHHL